VTRCLTVLAASVLLLAAGCGGGQLPRGDLAPPTGGRDPYNVLLEALRSAQPPLQAYACELFLDTDRPPPVADIRPLADSPDPRVRMLAVTVLGSMRRPELSPAFQQKQRDGDAAVRLAAAFALAMSGDGSGMTSLRDALASSDVAQRRNGVWLLGLIGDASATGMLKLKLDDPDALVALRAAEALHRLACDDGLDVVRILTEHDHHEIRFWAARLLGRMGQVADVPRLERLVQSRFLDVKFEAIAALAERGDLKRIEMLLSFIDVPDADTRLLAIRALGETGYTPAVDRLAGVVAKGDLVERATAAGSILRIQSTRQSWRSRILAERAPATPPPKRAVGQGGPPAPPRGPAREPLAPRTPRGPSEKLPDGALR